MTQITIELPEQLAEQLRYYLSEHPEENMTKIIKEALYVRQVPDNFSELLGLAGIVKESRKSASEHAEDFED